MVGKFKVAFYQTISDKHMPRPLFLFPPFSSSKCTCIILKDGNAGNDNKVIKYAKVTKQFSEYKGAT